MAHIYSSNVLNQSVFRGSDGEAHHVFQNLCSEQSPDADLTKYREVSMTRGMTVIKKDRIDSAQKWFILTGKNGKQHKFPLQTTLPKVQLLRNVPHKTLPRDVEVDRRRRLFVDVDIQKLLEEAGITRDDLMPTEEQFTMVTDIKFKHFLPLSVFDDSDLYTHSPAEWLNLGKVESGTYPVPAKVFLPHEKALFYYSWQYASVSKYNSDKFVFTVQSLDDDCIYEVPAIQILFLAEDPRLYVKRLQKAIHDRNVGEKQMMIESTVDCLLPQEAEENLSTSIEEIEDIMTKFARRNSALKRVIRKEVYRVYEHIMAMYEFDKYVKLMPKEFPDFGDNLILDSMPRRIKLPEYLQEVQTVSDINFDVRGTRRRVLHLSLFYIPAAIRALRNLFRACQKIETMSLFLCNFGKAVTLTDFLDSQETHSHHMAVFLKQTWPGNVSGGVLSVLRPNGKGWLDVTLKDWAVFGISKISPFIVLIKFCMQESMQILLEKSINKFCSLLTKPCVKFLPLQKNFRWTNNYIKSQFPYPAPIFSMIISVSEERKVVYSTDPKEFERRLVHIFRQILEKTTGIRRVDAEIMSNMKFSPDLYIETVELIDGLYQKWNYILKRSYKQAVIPLRAYARLFNRFIDFFLIQVPEFMRDYQSRTHTSSEVKHDILEHKRQKEELRRILPASIVIGPFLINIDLMKQSMIKKHIEIIKRLFEYYVQRMYDITEALLERCLEVFQSIAERPQSIEHLLQIRDFAATVPDEVETLRADIQIMWLEYDILDTFFYNLSDTQFAMKWEVYGWPQKILNRLTNLREEQKQDIDDFKRIHMSEIIGFEEGLESLNEEVQAFSLVFDPTKAVETSVDVKKTWKRIMESQKLGNTLQSRQELFDLEPLSLEFLESIIVGFTPYRQLWLTCVDFLKLEEATTGNPIANIDLEAVWASIEEIRAILKEAYDTFDEKPEVRNVATYYLEKLDEFVPVWQCIKWLKNENWLFMHWQELANRAGFEIKYSAAMNFLYLQRKGVMDSLDIVQEISEKAESEANEYRRQLEEEERRKRAEEEAITLRKALRKCRRDILWEQKEE